MKIQLKDLKVQSFVTGEIKGGYWYDGTSNGHDQCGAPSYNCETPAPSGHTACYGACDFVPLPTDGVGC